MKERRGRPKKKPYEKKTTTVPKFKMVGSREAVVNVFVGMCDLACKGKVTIRKGSPLHMGKKDGDEEYLIGDIQRRDGGEYANIYKTRVGQRAMLQVIRKNDPVGYGIYEEELQRAKTNAERTEVVDNYFREYMKAWKRMGWLKASKDGTLWATLKRGAE